MRASVPFRNKLAAHSSGTPSVGGAADAAARDLAAYQETLFSSPEVKLLADAILSGSSTFPDPDPELNEWNRWQSSFNRGCARATAGRCSEWFHSRCGAVVVHQRATTTSTVHVAPGHEAMRMSRTAGA